MLACKVLKHAWIMEDGVAPDEAMLPEVLVNMRRFAHTNKLKKEASKVQYTRPVQV